MPLLLLGGTFDPPHVGHLVLAECARDQFGGRVLFIPAGDPWRKTNHVVAPTGHRLTMTELVTATVSDFAVDAREVDRAGPSYTVDTLAELHADGHRDLILLLGSDAFADLPNWKEPDRIRELATLAVAARGDFPVGDGVVRVAMPPLEVSSTEIRERVAAGRSIRFLVPDAVRDYITHHGLYR